MGTFDTTKAKDKKGPVYMVAGRVYHLRECLGLEVQVSEPVTAALTASHPYMLVTGQKKSLESIDSGLGWG